MPDSNQLGDGESALAEGIPQMKETLEEMERIFKNLEDPVPVADPNFDNQDELPF